MGNKYNYDFDMKYTDNPYIDLIVNCVKILGMNAVVKNENQALHYEDSRSAIEASKLMKYKEGHWNTAKDGYFDEDYYMEWNSYYRMLNGLPPAYTLNDEKAYLDATGYGNSVFEDIGNAYVIPDLYKRYFIDVGPYKSIYEGRYLHELNEEELSILIADGTLDQIKADYADDTHYQYIYHLGDKRIDFYTARKAVNFSLLYLPQLNTFDIIENKFRRVYDRNRKYTMATVYSEAYRFMSYHYDAFIQILIIIQTMVDMISEVQEYIINKDVFDSRTIRYLFESYGIAYYKEIPVKYQIRIIKNVNTLLKYKSSHRNIIDILELFDDDTITVYTYYLMKTKRIHRDNFYYYTEADINPKYNTGLIYYIGRPEDISNNKVPLMSVQYNQDDTRTIIDEETKNIIKDNFIRTHVYGYSLINLEKPDTSDNRQILDSDYQPIAGKFADSLQSLTAEKQISNSFICEFLDNTAKGVNGLPWFGAEDYNKNYSNSTKYLEKRNKFLNNFKSNLANVIKLVFDEETQNDKNFALNQFHVKRIKYRIYSILGIFDYDNIDFDNITDAELNDRFYNPDDFITESYCIKHGINFDDYKDSENKYLLNHTIPFMTWFGYREKTSRDAAKTIDDYLSDNTCYIFNSNGSFSALPGGKLGDLYEKYTAIFRENYCIAARVYVEAVFDDMAYDYLNNPTPRYIGWIDIGYAISKTGKSLDELELGDEIDTTKDNNIPIYNSAYVYEVITEDMIGKEYFRKNYDLCFLKVPILDPNAYKMLERKDMRKSYDSITLADPFWDGVSTFDILTDEERDKLHQSKKQEILNKDFTIERTKYIAVEASIDLTKMSYQVSYFMNMLYDKHIDEELLMVEVDPLIAPTKVRLNDLLTFAIALNFIYNGVEPDNIASDMEKNMYINGFNFDTDWTDIYNYLQNRHFINNNYLNEIHEYSYVNEYGETITNEGYGMSPMNKGWMTEWFDDFVVYGTIYDEKTKEYREVKTYMGQPIYGLNENGDPIFFYPDEAVKPDTSVRIDTDKTTNERALYTDDEHYIPNPQVGAFLSGRYEKCDDDCTETVRLEFDFGESDIWNYNLKNHAIVDMNGNISTINIAWEPTQYPDTDNNSHGLWMTTEILNHLDEASTDLERINMLKKIYYSNTNLYNHLTYMMRHAESKRMYDIYKVLFDSFMETKMNHEYYGLIDENGNPVYVDENTGDLYHISKKEKYLYDEEGFPLFRGHKIQEDDTDIPTTLYRLKHNDDFTDCWYVNVDEYYKPLNNITDKFECLYNLRVFEEYGRKEYIMNEDINDRFPRTYYMTPASSDYTFVFESEYGPFLVNANNPDIYIPIEFDEDGNVKLDENKFYIDENGNVIVRPKDEKPQGGETEIVIKRKIAESYYDFLQYRNPSLYSHLIDLKYNYKNVPVMDENNKVLRYVPSDDKRKRIEVICELIVAALEKYFDKKEWRYIFNLIPTANIQNIQNYIMKMVVFFKSWKTQILDTTVSYVIDDPFNNHVHIIDDMYYNTTFDNLLEKVRPKEYKYFLNHMHYKDPVKVGEKVDFEDVIFEPYKIDFGFAEKMYGHNFDYPNLTSKLNFKDKIGPGEKVEMNTVYYTGDVQTDSNGNILLP